MTAMRILTEAELRRIVPLDLDAIACVEGAFHALATKAVAMPPIHSIMAAFRKPAMPNTPNAAATESAVTIGPMPRIGRASRTSTTTPSFF